jgi:HEAT repeat protein
MLKENLKSTLIKVPNLKVTSALILTILISSVWAQPDSDEERWAKSYPPIDKRCTVSQIRQYLESLNLQAPVGLTNRPFKACEKKAPIMLSKFLHNQDSNIRSLAAYVLISTNFDKKNGISVLIELLKDKNVSVRTRAAYVLGQFQVKEAIPALKAVLKDKEVSIRVLAALSLVYLNQDFRGLVPNQDFRDLVPPIIEALENKDAELRSAAAQALGIVGKNYPDVTPKLIAATKDQNIDVRITAIQALGEIGKDAKTVIPNLISALEDKEIRVLEAAVVGLRKFGSEARDAYPALISALKKVDEQHKIEPFHFYLDSSEEDVSKFERFEIASGGILSQFAYTLKEFGKEVIPLLVDALKEDNKNVRQVAIKALGLMGSNGKDSVPALVSLFSNKDLGNLAAQAVGQITKKAKENIPLLITALQDKKPLVRANAAESLERVGKNGKEAVPLLITLLNDQDKEVRNSAISALKAFGKEIVPSLVILLDSKDTDTRSGAVDILSSIGIDAAPALITALRDKNVNIRSSAALAFFKMSVYKDEDKQKILPVLVEATKDLKEVVRNRAILAIRELDSETKNLPLISKASLADEDKLVRLSAARNLINTDPSLTEQIIAILVSSLDESDSFHSLSDEFEKIGKDAVPALITALKHPDKVVREAAIDGLKQIGNNAQAAIPELLEALKDESVSSDAALALTTIIVNKREIVPALVSAFQSQDNYRIAESLELIGKDAVPELIIAYQKGDSKTRVRIASIFGGIGANAKAAAPILRKYLKHQDKEVRISSLVALESIVNPSDIDTFFDRPSERKKRVRYQAAVNPSKIDIPILIELLGDDDENIRYQAALILHKRAKYVIPELTKALKNNNPYIRKGAAFALSNVRHLPQITITSLKAIVDNESEDLDVRRVAASTLEITGLNMQLFFEKYNFVSPKNAVCPNINVGGLTTCYYKFNIYTGQCGDESCLTLCSGTSYIFNALRRFFRRS